MTEEVIEHYDAIVCGTGFTECIVSGLLSTAGKKVLHVDRNGYYGGESASLNLTHLFNKFAPGEAPPAQWGHNRDWNIDLIPKFIMANGKLVRMLIKTNVKEYLEFQVVEGSYVYQHQKAGWFSNEKYIHKVPATESEVLSSSLIPMAEKLRGRNFFALVARWGSDPAATQKLISEGLDPERSTMAELYKHFAISENIADFVGHSIALEFDDQYLNKPYGQTMDKLKLYVNSLLRYGRSPFIYPMYGLGTLPEAFSRLSAVHGGVYMLNTPVKKFLFDANGRIEGVEFVDNGMGVTAAKASVVICDPSYIVQQTPIYPSLRTKKIAPTSAIIRSICILNRPLPGTNDRNSLQLILPQRQIGRNNDIYIAVLGGRALSVCEPSKYVAIVSTVLETIDLSSINLDVNLDATQRSNIEVTPQYMKEIEPAMKLLGNVERVFTDISVHWTGTSGEMDRRIQNSDNSVFDNIFVSDSYDASSHFESATENCLQLYKWITGDDLDISFETLKTEAAAKERASAEEERIRGGMNMDGHGECDGLNNEQGVTFE